VNKPLLVLPPSPARWPAIETLLSHEPAERLNDLKLRLSDPPAAAADAFAIQPDGAHSRAFACLRRTDTVGVLGDLYTHPEHRRRGLARRLMQTLLSWFDMTGGKWLYAFCPADLHAAFFEHFGFRVLHRASSEPSGMLALLRTPGNVTTDPITSAHGHVTVREATRADWPLIVSLLQHRSGPDTRVNLAESALAAEATAFDLLAQHDRGVCSLLVATAGHRVVAVGTLAIQLGQRTYAMTMPPGDRHSETMRSALLDLATRKGYAQVDFPMELAALGAAGAAPDALHAGATTPAQ
jgi:GNAT superfamily N-acetyltransferase